MRDFFNPDVRPFSIPQKVYWITGANTDSTGTRGMIREGTRIDGEIIDAYYQFKDQPRGREEGWRCIICTGVEMGEVLTMEKYFHKVKIC